MDLFRENIHALRESSDLGLHLIHALRESGNLMAILLHLLTKLTDGLTERCKSFLHNLREMVDGVTQLLNRGVHLIQQQAPEFLPKLRIFPQGLKKPCLFLSRQRSSTRHTLLHDTQKLDRRIT